MGVNSLFSDRQLQLHRMMTKYLLLALFLGVAMAAEYDDSALMDNGEGRFLYLNSSSTATSLTLPGAVILLGVIFYLVYAGGLLSPAASSYSRYGQDYNQYYQGYQGQARSSNEGWGFNPMAVIQWISMLQEVYEKFDYNDVECQKRLICEVLNLPDEFRELIRHGSSREHLREGGIMRIKKR